MKAFGEKIRLFRRNLPSVFVFELIYKLLVFAVITPFFYTCVNFSVSIAGIGFLTPKTLRKYLLSPFTYVIAICLLFVFALLFLMHISALIYAMEASYRKERTNSVYMLFKGCANALRVFNIRNIGMIVYCMLIFPFVGSVIITGYLFSAKIPEFIFVFLFNHRFFLAGLIVVYLILCMFASRRIFAINYFTIYKMDFKEAMRASKRISRRHVVGLTLGLIALNILFIAGLVLLEGTLISLIAKMLRRMISYKKLVFVITVVIQIAFVILYMLVSIIAIPFIYSYICHRFYEWDEEALYVNAKEKKERKRKHKPITEEQKDKRNRIATIVVVVISIILNGLYIHLSINKKMNLNMYWPNRVSVAAHRGDSQNAPENTMAAFRLAVENQADVIELDVRQTRDGKYIIMHDDSLKRTTGLDRKVGEVNYEYIKMLEAGSYFSEEYRGEPIPTLEEVLEFAIENDIELNIELKPAHTDQNYEEGIIALLEQYDFVSKCVVASSDYEVLRRVKEINPDVKTVYIVHIAFGGVGELEYADAVSMRYNYISANLVKSLHKQDKDIYAWTVNGERMIKNLLLMDVDCIVTDNPYNTKEVIYNANDTILSDWLSTLIDEY